MGALDYLTGVFDFSMGVGNSGKESSFSLFCLLNAFFFLSKTHQTVEIKVKMDCEGCVRKVKKAVEGMEGVTQVVVDQKHHKLTVIGYVEPNKVLKRVCWRTRKKAELWPYVPYDSVDHPYAPGTYDKRAPAGYVRNTMGDPRTTALGRASSTEIEYSNAFSDENPNACSIM